MSNTTDSKSGKTCGQCNHLHIKPNMDRGICGALPPDCRSGYTEERFVSPGRQMCIYFAPKPEPATQIQSIAEVAAAAIGAVAKFGHVTGQAGAQPPRSGKRGSR